MWGVEQLWPETFLIAAGLVQRWRWGLIAFLILYGFGVWWQRESTSALLAFDTKACQLNLTFVGLTAFMWWVSPLSQASGWAVLLQLGSYGLLLRSVNLAFSWALMESGAIGGYFLVANAGASPERWGTAIRYLTWSVIGSALVLLSIAVRLVEHHSLFYPLESGGEWADHLFSIGWALKVGFIPWHFWMMSLYRTLPVAWGGWFSIVPKGALLLNLLSSLKEGGLKLDLWYGHAILSMLGAYALGWRAQDLTEMIFWGSFAQGAYTALAATAGGKEAGWDFWQVYSIGGPLALLYASVPWQSREGRSIGLLLLANLAAVPPILGFWVKLQLFWVSVAFLSEGERWVLIGAALFATIGGFAVYGKLLWRLWHQEAVEEPPLILKSAYILSSIVL
ncbi:MAG: hypothetical protein NZ611_02105, partial [Bacteroidia bacterium]|nr:hypothetical protein [Bacteroidia bacterium]